MVEPTKKIWMDGEMVDWRDANVHILTHSLHYGAGAFEGVRCYELSNGRSAIFRLKCHTRRLFDGMKILAMEPTFTENEINDACVKIALASGLKECYIRPIAYLGDGEMGVSVINRTRIAVIAWKWGAYLGDGALERGVRAKISSFARHHVNVGMVQGKIIGQYVTPVLAKREIINAGYQEAIMLDTLGYVAEGTGQNIFAVRDGVIHTPPMSSPILPGVTRDSIITMARQMNMKVKEEVFTRDFLYICDEVFLTGTAAEVTPVCEVDDRRIGSGKPGPITQNLQKAYFDVVHGNNECYMKWLTII